MKLKQKYEHLQRIVSEKGGAVAFSGGADSTLLLKAAVDALGDRAQAFFANSLLQTAADVDNALRTAQSVGAKLKVFEISPLEWPDFTANPADRCYLCKKKVYKLFKNLLPGKGSVLFDGTNLDDRMQSRPGQRAIDELEVRTPLVEADLTKKEIRLLGRQLGLRSWDRPSSSCLATRIPCGTPITAERLRLVAVYENILHASGYFGCRVRLNSDDPESVKIELQEADILQLTESGRQEKIIASFESLGVLKLCFGPRS